VTIWSLGWNFVWISPILSCVEPLPLLRVPVRRPLLLFGTLDAERVIVEIEGVGSCDRVVFGGVYSACRGLIDISEPPMLSPEQLDHAQSVLKHTFADQELLQRAFVHASVTDSRLTSNERLEFLGDAILGMFVCERIFTRYPNYLEGEMTKIKSLAVSRATCAKLAIDLGLDLLIRVGKGMMSQPSLPSSLAAAITESVIAALYIDGGMKAVRLFLEPLIDPLIDAAVDSGHQHNFKSVLQQHVQRVHGVSPMYRILDEKGPDHDKSFQIGVQVHEEIYEPSWGQSKKQAEQHAAMNALHAMGVVELDGDGQAMMTEL